MISCLRPDGRFPHLRSVEKYDKPRYFAPCIFQLKTSKSKEPHRRKAESSTRYAHVGALVAQRIQQTKTAKEF